MTNSIQFLVKQFENKDDEINLQRKNHLISIAESLKTHHSSTAHQLMFICTHNSRRSIFGQVWAKVLADYYNISLESYSGGTEVTAVHDHTLSCLSQLGFEVNKLENKSNPKIELKYGNSNVINCFSKLYDDTQNPSENFYAMMLCEHAAQNCPFIPNALKRFNLTFSDPKQFDNTVHQDEKYKGVALKIGQELSFLMRQL